MKVVITRTNQTCDGVFGDLLVLDCGIAPETILRLVTIEDDWLDNKTKVSCIPAGTYKLRRSFFYRKGYECFEVCGVQGRSRILIHKANTENDVEGCIGVGLRLGEIVVLKDEDTGAPNVKKLAAVSSASAFAKFMDALKDCDELPLEIRWAEGLPKNMGY